jgi:hypothetical protein
MLKKRVMIIMATVALAAFMAGPALAAVTNNESIPFNLTIFVPCANGGAGELVALSGSLHVLTTVTINGNNVSMSTHSQPQGVSGVGLTTGDKYRGTGVTRSDTNYDNVDFPFVTTYVNNFRVIGQGPGNNFTVHETLHTTVNANGDATADFDNIKVDCK